MSKSAVAVGQTEVMAEAIEKVVVETKAKCDESEEERVTENTLPDKRASSLMDVRYFLLVTACDSCACKLH